jgi:3'-phosphoadenosine 5'-phosphosulfate sulfotransferase (PAPS reductase)/FAD synthetase
LPETYDFLNRLEARLGKKIEWLEAERGFDHWLDVYGGYLPSPQARWCTKKLKIEPLEKFIGDDTAISYIGIRADEDRVGYISSKNNIKPRFPFMTAGIVKRDVIGILEKNGIGLPEYYNWRSRSGCYFCFFQRKYEWVMLSKKHPDLFEKAVKYEQKHDDGRVYLWNQDGSLSNLIERGDQVIKEHIVAMKRKKQNSPNRPLVDVLSSVLDDEDENFCFVCNL